MLFLSLSRVLSHLSIWHTRHSQLIDLYDFEDSDFIIPGGQTGNSLSADYTLYLSLWQAGKYIPMNSVAYEVAAQVEIVPRQS